MLCFCLNNSLLFFLVLLCITCLAPLFVFDLAEKISHFWRSFPLPNTFDGILLLAELVNVGQLPVVCVVFIVDLASY